MNAEPRTSETTRICFGTTTARIDGSETSARPMEIGHGGRLEEESRSLEQ